ncbi:hypothetical protein BKA70DRAFT_1538086 [Coprinopsis sp. MPI-PUGE-AT-0042]|nr:hypothetical protein BKA70DRAFT_1538086 [Coprinopsis sp. MPI-PUGE-AT-0042]
MATYPTNAQSAGVALQYQPHALGNHGFQSHQQGALMQNLTSFQNHQNGYPVDGSESAHSPHTPQPNLMIHNHPTQQVAVVNVGVPAPKLDPGATPRLESALRCLYATLSLSIPIYILQITTLFEPGGSLWILPIALMFTIIFSSTVIMVTFRDRARMHPNSTKAPPTLPAICRLPTLVCGFLVAVLWIVALGIMIFTMRVTIALSPYPEDIPLLSIIIGCVEVFFVVAQICLLSAFGRLGEVERKHAKQYVTAVIVV